MTMSWEGNFENTGLWLLFTPMGHPDFHLNQTTLQIYLGLLIFNCSLYQFGPRCLVGNSNSTFFWADHPPPHPIYIIIGILISFFLWQKHFPLSPWASFTSKFIGWLFVLRNPCLRNKSHWYEFVSDWTYYWSCKLMASMLISPFARWYSHYISFGFD